MRYLSRGSATGALRRGNGVEQFLGAVEVDGCAGIRSVDVSPLDGGFVVSLHTVQDLDDEEFLDLAEYPPLDPDEDEEYVGAGREVGRETDPLAAIELAERLVAAAPGRWVNQAMAVDEYGDFIRARLAGPGI